MLVHHGECAVARSLVAWMVALWPLEVVTMMPDRVDPAAALDGVGEADFVSGISVPLCRGSLCGLLA